jgi:SAM-dependent methyltransferase
MISLSPRAFLHLIWNGSKGVDVVQAALEVGLLDLLDAGPIAVDDAAARLGLVPGRLDKLLHCLETLGLVARVGGETDARYRSVDPLAAAARAALGPESVERDRDKHPWRTIHGRLPEVLRGGPGIPPDRFPWPLETSEQIEGFEASMSLGCLPIAESFLAARAMQWNAPPSGELRLLDVGGGDGTLAERLLGAEPRLRADVYNLPEVVPLVVRRADARADGRLGWVAGDFLREELPRGYHAIGFVRVLHDWPASIATELIAKAWRALEPGGRIFVCEEFRDAERLAIQFFWSYFLVGLDGCQSRLRERDFYLSALAAAGFMQVTVLPAPFEIVAAVKP